MNDDRRRYFRIQETLGLSWQLLDGGGSEGSNASPAADLLSMVSEQDRRIEKLLIELAEENPKVSELVSLFNQKLERVVNQIVLDNSLVNRIANKVKEANISACGIAFVHEEKLPPGSNLRLELTLLPEQKHLTADGRLVGCDPSNDGLYYWRIDFLAISKSDQEELIQHIVKSQSQQLKMARQM